MRVKADALEAVLNHLDQIVVETVTLVVVLNQLDEVGVKADAFEAFVDHLDEIVVEVISLVVLDHWTRSWLKLLDLSSFSISRMKS